MKLFAVAVICLLSSYASLSAKAADLSLDARRMLSYGTTAVEVKVCDLPITKDETTQMMTALVKYGDAQKDLSREDFSEAMEATGTKIGSDKDAICRSDRHAVGCADAGGRR